MVHKYSQGATAEKDGYIGLLGQDEFRRIFNARKSDVRAVFGLETGDISRVVNADKAWHIFEVIAKRPDIAFNVVNKVMDKKALRDLVDYSYNFV